MPRQARKESGTQKDIGSTVKPLAVPHSFAAIEGGDPECDSTQVALQLTTSIMPYDKKSYTKKWGGKGSNRESFTLNREPAKYKPKRGKLAPLMKEEEKEKAGIHELSYDFACRITRLFQYLTEDTEYKEYVQSKQIYRSGTSIGANVRESKHAQSDADFLSKMSIAYKEADETDFWLNLLHDNGYLDDKQFNSLENDITRILKILTSIVKTMNEKVKKK
jgi:four helix bundle protein